MRKRFVLFTSAERLSRARPPALGEDYSINSELSLLASVLSFRRSNGGRTPLPTKPPRDSNLARDSKFVSRRLMGSISAGKRNNGTLIRESWNSG